MMLLDQVQVAMIPISEVRPSPENDKLYRPADPNDPEIIGLAEGIARDGVLVPLVIDLGGWIISGHRRYLAAKLAGLVEVPCQIEPIHKEDDLDAFMVLLREHNRQRIKSIDEIAREEAISFDPENCYQDLVNRRRVATSRTCPEAMVLGKKKKRSRITDVKQDMVDAVLRVVENLRELWPIDGRKIHYELLSDPSPLRNTSDPTSTYINNRKCSKDLSDLVTRLRLTGELPMEAIDDSERIVIVPNTDPDPATFIRRELDWLFDGYRRDLLRSQPCHIELVVEKKTLKGVLAPVAEEFTMPVTFAKGKSSIPPRRDIAKRFKRSGKDMLLLILVTDCDPDGDVVAESFVRSMRDDFKIGNVTGVRAALTPSQATAYNLPKNMEAKKSSPTYRAYVKRHNTDAVWELEALPYQTLRRIVRDCIIANLDVPTFNKELQTYKNECAELAVKRAAIKRLIGGAA